MTFTRLLPVVLLAAAALAEDRTPSGRAGVFDYYLLTLSWSPEFCATHSGDSQCAPQRHFGFVVHGFWPQYDNGRWPQFCSQAPGLRNPASMLDIMPSPSLIRHEWEKHGTCSGLPADGYFQLTRQAFSKIRIPQRFNRPAQTISISPAELSRALVDANPGLSRDDISVQCSRQYLSEVRVCLSKSLSPIPCTSERSCPRPSIVMPPVR
jgi:ribonuclease T2